MLFPCSPGKVYSTDEDLRNTTYSETNCMFGYHFMSSHNEESDAVIFRAFPSKEIRDRVLPWQLSRTAAPHWQLTNTLSVIFLNG